MFNIQTLDEAWVEYNKNWSNICRFGQYLSDQLGIEAADSYYIEDNLEVYQIIYSTL